MSGEGVQIAKREMAVVRPSPVLAGRFGWLKACAIAGTIGCGLGLNDRVWPYTQLATPPRTAFWLVLSLVVASHWMLARGLFPERLGHGRIGKIAKPVVFLIALAPLWGIECAIGSKLIGLTVSLPFTAAVLLFTKEFLKWGVVLVLPLAWIADWRAEQAAPPATEFVGEQALRSEKHSEADLLSRIPLPFRAPIVALKAEDHYVRVFTRKGDTLILMRFADALLQLEPSSGIQVHRSYWIRKDAVQAVVRNGRRSQVHLTNGIVVPVSRACERAVKSGLSGAIE